MISENCGFPHFREGRTHDTTGRFRGCPAV